MNLVSALVAGAAGGAAGTTALNAVTDLDMAVRGRSTSSAPEDSIEALVSRTGLRIPGEEDTRKNRVAGLGPLNGIFVGVGIGPVLGSPAPLAGGPTSSLLDGSPDSAPWLPRTVRWRRSE